MLGVLFGDEGAGVFRREARTLVGSLKSWRAQSGERWDVALRDMVLEGRLEEVVLVRCNPWISWVGRKIKGELKDVKVQEWTFMEKEWAGLEGRLVDASKGWRGFKLRCMVCEVLDY